MCFKGKYIKDERIPVEEVIPAILDTPQKIRGIIRGDEVKLGGSLRLRTFLRSLKCVKCGIQGEFFIKTRTKEDERWHLDLYALRDGEPVLMTKDHIIPRSKGGKDRMDNLQTMCCECNEEKGNTLCES